MEPLEQAKEQLKNEESATLAVVYGSETFTSRARGIAPLMGILADNPGLLRGASVADRIVGRAAAFLMAKGGVKELDTDIVSEPAVRALEGFGIRASYRTVTPSIVNREGTGLCPMEQTVLEITDPEEAYLALGRKIAELRSRN